MYNSDVLFPLDFEKIARTENDFLYEFNPIIFCTACCVCAHCMSFTHKRVCLCVICVCTTIFIVLARNLCSHAKGSNRINSLSSTP